MSINIIKTLKWVSLGLGIVIVLMPPTIYLASALKLGKTYDVALTPLRVAPSPALAPEGERLANVFGCLGCHHANGNVLFEGPGVGHLVAPNLTRKIRDYSDEEFVRLVRYGVKRDGTGIIAMPSAGLNALSDDDLAAILSWLRTQPQLKDAQPAVTSWGPFGRIAMLLGAVPFSAEKVVPQIASLHRPMATPAEQGAYLVQAICSDCHNLDTEHDNGWGIVTPPVRMMVQAYPLPDFRRLMRTGVALGDRDVNLMSTIARSDLSHMRDDEIDAIHAYLNESESQDAE
ncbi:MAG: c-type cytochrome [Rhizobiales bacterium]|nr:c-type cytochrome [Hyphomicrobiales bacterium]